MSGGNYNFLYRQIAWNNNLDLNDLMVVRDRLRELAPDSLATKATDHLYETLTAAGIEGDGTLTEVWRAVEWLDSGDYGVEQVEEAVHAYDEEAARR